MTRFIWAEGLLAMSCWSWAADAYAPGPSHPRVDRYDGLILAYSQRRGLNPKLVKAIIAAESGFSPGARSRRGAQGLMQLMPATATEFGADAADLDDAETNIAAGTRYLGWLCGRARSTYGLPPGSRLSRPLERRVVAAYNGGPRCILNNRWAPETRSYVEHVMRLARSPLATLRPVELRKF